MISYIIYMSKTVKHMTDGELQQILQISRSWNKAHQLTGLLLYIESDLLKHAGGRFIQVLEGEEAEVNHIFEKIRNDPMHYNVVELNRGTYKKRNFANWEMGFEAMSIEKYQQMPGFFSLDDGALHEKKQSRQINIPMTFLRSFYDMNARPR